MRQATASPSDPAPLAGRLFLALPLDPGASATLGRLVDPWRAAWPGGGRSSPPAQWHLTLRFLGEGRPVAAQALLEGIDRLADWPSLNLMLRGWGAFPRPGAARVLWLGVAEAEGRRRLLDLAMEVESLAVAAGYPPEAKGFRPHLTLGRFAGPRSLEAALAVAPPVAIRWQPEALVLFRSRLLPSGAVHLPLRRWPLPTPGDHPSCASPS